MFVCLHAHALGTRVTKIKSSGQKFYLMLPSTITSLGAKVAGSAAAVTDELSIWEISFQ